MHDDVDHQILSILRRDARVSITTLAAQVGRSRTAVQARLDRLQRDGQILRYTIEEPGRRNPDEIGAFVKVALVAQREGPALVEILRDMPQVLACRGIAGEFAFMVLLRRLEHAELQSTLQHIYTLPGVLKTETVLTLTYEF